VFGPWRLDPADLYVDEYSGFTTLRFEAQRPIFTSRATPPNLDIVLASDDNVVAVESKLTEYLAGKERASFAARYRDVVAEFADESWAAMYKLLDAEPAYYSFLNADQLVKHYLGLRRAQLEDERPAMLLYLYWEPTNPEDSAYVMHRRVLAVLAYLRAGAGAG